MWYVDIPRLHEGVHFYCTSSIKFNILPNYKNFKVTIPMANVHK